MSGFKSTTEEEQLADDAGILTEQLVVNVDDKTVVANIIYLDRSCFIWIGSSDAAPALRSLIISLPTKFGAMPLSTTLLDEGNDLTAANGIAVRLSKKLNIQTFISCNLPTTYDDTPILAAIEKKLSSSHLNVSGHVASTMVLFTFTFHHIGRCIIYDFERGRENNM